MVYVNAESRGVRERTPLLNGGRVRARRAAAAVASLGVFVGCVLVGMAVWTSGGRSGLLQKEGQGVQVLSAADGEGVKMHREMSLAKALWARGEDEEEAGNNDVREARCVTYVISTVCVVAVPRHAVRSSRKQIDSQSLMGVFGRAGVG